MPEPLSFPSDYVILIEESKAEETLDAFHDYLANGGPWPAGATVVPFAEWTAIGRVPDCDCQHIQCVCLIKRTHKDDCPFRRAVTCAIGIPCEKHGYEVCPECDPCTCQQGATDDPLQASTASL